MSEDPCIQPNLEWSYSTSQQVDGSNDEPDNIASLRRRKRSLQNFRFQKVNEDNCDNENDENEDEEETKEASCTVTGD
jgi:hypothetical protein